MAVKDTKLMVFAHLGTAWAPCGQFVLTEEADREAVRAKRLLPANQLPFFGGIRYAGPDADLLSTAPINGATEHRMGFVSGLTLTGCDEAEPRTKSYADLAEAVRRHCHPAVIRKDTAELFKRMIFNIFVSNDDDLRNNGFLCDPRLPGWRLSPLDVLPRAQRPSTTRSPRRFGTSTTCPLQPCGSGFREAGQPKPGLRKCKT